MIIFRTPQPSLVIVRKARRKKWKATRTYARLNALTNAMGKAVKVDFVKGITKFKSRLDPADVYRAWLSRDYSKVYETIPWEKLREDMAPMTDSVQAMLESSSDKVVNALPTPVRQNLRWDMKNPAVRDYVGNRTGELVTGIEENTKGIIASAIARSFDDALTPRRVASIIRPSIGLYPGQTNALANFRLGLEKQGVSETKVEDLSGKYEKRLLDYRATMVARTESSFARNQGQLSVWRAATDQGLLDKATAQKVWITDGDPCPECVDIEDQGPIDLDDSWDSDEGPIDAPPLHPNCFCGMELNFGDSQEKMEDSEPEGGDENEEEETEEG